MRADGTTDARWTRLRRDIGRLVAQRMSRPADVEDITQDIMIRLWNHPSDQHDDERIGRWLSRVVHNAVVDHWRARGQRQHVPYDDEAAVGGDHPHPAGTTGGIQPSVKELIATVLRPFVAQLDPPYRAAITLSELEGLDHAEVAARLSLSVSGVKSRVQRGRARLRDLLERCCAFALDGRGAPISCEVRPGAVPPVGCCAPGTSAGQKDRSRG